MKQTQKIFIAVVLISIVSACTRENSGDNNTAVEEKNEQKFDTRAEEKEANFVAEGVKISRHSPAYFFKTIKIIKSNK